MRVLIINTSERIGGAAIAAGRLMESLKNNGIKAKMLVRDKQTDQISVVGLKRSWLQVWKFMWERIVIWSANRFQRYHLFDVDIANTGTDITSLPEFRQADVIHLHWINPVSYTHLTLPTNREVEISVVAVYFKKKKNIIEKKKSKILLTRERRNQQMEQCESVHMKNIAYITI